MTEKECGGCGKVSNKIDYESGLCPECYKMEEEKMKKEITKEDFMKYEKARKSGKCNMFDLSMVEEFTGLGKDKLFDIMCRYKELYNKFIGKLK